MLDRKVDGEQHSCSASAWLPLTCRYYMSSCRPFWLWWPDASPRSRPCVAASQHKPADLWEEGCSSDGRRPPRFVQAVRQSVRLCTDRSLWYWTAAKPKRQRLVGGWTLVGHWSWNLYCMPTVYKSIYSFSTVGAEFRNLVMIFLYNKKEHRVFCIINASKTKSPIHRNLTCTHTNTSHSFTHNSWIHNGS